MSREGGSESVTHNINNNVLAHQKVLQGQLVLDLVLPMFGHLGDQEDIRKLRPT